jgi:methionyl aminopeptidase
MAIIIKSAQEIATMRQAGRIVALTLAALAERLLPGITTLELDRLAEQIITQEGATPSFKGYRGFPASLCVSINDEVVHGIPGKRLLRAGDIVSLDVGAIYQGYQGDAAITVGVGRISKRAAALIEAAQEALAAGIAAAQAGNRLSDISWAIQSSAEARGFSVVREYVGHGIGRDMHEDPQIPNFGPPGQGVLLKPGMTFALEPMLNSGGHAVRVKSDNWTVVTMDGGLSAHYEHTIAVTEGEPEILTRL